MFQTSLFILPDFLPLVLPQDSLGCKELYPRVILPAADVDVENFSLWRSPQWGAITTATVEQVDLPTLELIAPWTSKERAKGTEAGLPMRQVYTDQRLTVRAMLRFSKAL